MFYVYRKRLSNGKEEYIRQFESEYDAVRHVAKCYRIDAETCQAGEYYYFIVQH